MILAVAGGQAGVHDGAKLDFGMPKYSNIPDRTAPPSSRPRDCSQPLSSEELARPFVSEEVPAADVDEHASALREHIISQQARLQDIQRQHAEAEAALVDRQRQLSDQRERATALGRQHAEAAAESIVRRRQLRKQQNWAAVMEGLAHPNLRAMARALLLLKAAFAKVRLYRQTGGALEWQQQEAVALELIKARGELTKARDAVSEIEPVLLNLADERARQASRVSDLTRLIAEQEAVVAEMGSEIAKQEDHIEELMREPVRDQIFANHPLVRLARSYRRDGWWPELQSLRSISMLHFETLYLLRSLAARTKDAIVEVGPYIGGSTIALGRGIQIGGGGPLISVEMGGSYPSHAVPTNDIVADLKNNVERYGLSEVVHIMEGFTTDPVIDAAVNRILAGKKIGLLFLDADGDVERDFELYRGRLSRGSMLVYDDYFTEQAPEKQTTIKSWVDQAVNSRMVENLGVYRWGTWVGRYWG
jgi:predicted O-methyltransferase YrrM